jgi:hypothetical protein
MGLLEFLVLAFALSLAVSVVLAFILFIVHLRRKENAIINQFGRSADEEVSHGRT